MNDISPQLLQHIMNNLPALLIRDFLLDILTETTKTTAVINHDKTATPESGGFIYTGKLLNIDGKLYGVTGQEGISSSKGAPVAVIPLDIPDTPRLCFINNKIVIRPGQIANYKGEEELHTTIGRLLLNYVFLVCPFGDYIEYVNGEWKIGQIESDHILDGLLSGKIIVDQIKQYSRNLHWLGHFNESAVPSFNERSLTVDPKIIERRDELLHKYKAELAAGDATVMAKIEAELIAMDRASLKGDVSTLFYDVDSRSYEIHRKTMLILGGMTQNFGDKGYNFISNSLEEGWDIKNLPAIANEIRRGSYFRAKETAKGGEATKFVVRVFQETRIIEDDCGSTNYLSVLLSDDMAKKYLQRNILVDNSLVTLNIENLTSFIGETVLMRSPMHCHTKNGYCFTCMGELFRAINQELLTMTGITISSTFTNAALKAKHSFKAKSITIRHLNNFVV